MKCVCLIDKDKCIRQFFLCKLSTLHIFKNGLKILLVFEKTGIKPNTETNFTQFFLYMFVLYFV